MPLSICQVFLQKRLIQVEFHPRNNSIIMLYADGELKSVSSEGKENWTISFECEPVSFNINAEGDLIAVLGVGKLFFYNLLTMQTKGIDVDEKIQLMEFYKNSVLLSGFQKNIILVKQTGSIQKSLDFDFFIRQFTVIPVTNNLIIYNQDRKLLCTDMNGKTMWYLENLIIHNKILVCEKGYIGYFILDPDDLIQFHVSGQSFFEVTEERILKCFSISFDGKYLLVLDSENELIMFNEQASKMWNYKFDHNINLMKMSSKGDFFLTVDNDKVLTCYTTDSIDKERGEFFELKDDKRVMDKEVVWSIRPGGYNTIASLNLLTVNSTGDLFGLIGKDGCINFYDEQGGYKFHTSFTSMVDTIEISDVSHYGFIYGGKEMIIADIKNKEKKYILFNKSPSGKPVINYHCRKVFMVSKERELLIYDFNGRLIDTISLTKGYNKMISCESHGVILINDEEIKGFSGEGKAIFTFPIGNEVADIFFSDPVLVCTTKGHSIFSIDLSDLKWKKMVFKDSEGEFKIVSNDPLFIATGNQKLYHLDSNLSTISTYKIKSTHSLFFMDGEHFYEIIRRRDSLFCYDDNSEMVWRYTTDERIKESALMRGGLVFITEDSARYLELKSKDKPQKDFSQYLEI
ncbi:hypothetical protein ACFL1N_11725 [Thermodesulfobacteriota bacterium]